MLFIGVFVFIDSFDSNGIVGLGFRFVVEYVGIWVIHSCAQRLAGVIALSAYLPLADLFAREVSTANQTLPIFLAHGSRDEVLPQEASEITKRYLEMLGYAVTLKVYNMAHQICDKEVTDMAAWLRQVL